MANTFIQLSDTPSDYSGKGLTFVRVKSDGSGLSFANADLNTLSDVNSSGGYTPQGGQILQYSSAAQEWRPGTNDPYSAGNGLSKTSGTLQVVATGGLVANASGVYIADVANVSGIHGSANTVPCFTVNSKGQITDVESIALVADSAQTITDDFVSNIQGMPGTIRVTGGEGNASNPTIELVATGVTAATYGNATHFPQITVDSYGRIQNVDLIQSIGGGSSEGDVSGISAEDAYNMHTYFKTIRVGGVRNENNEVYGVDVSAEKPQDILYIESLHDGLSLAPDANGDSVNFNINAGAIAADVALGDLADVDAQGIADGDLLIWNASTGKFETGTVGGDDSIIDLTDFAVTTTSATGGGSLSYNNNGTFTFAPADLSTYATQSVVSAANANMKSYVDTAISGISSGSDQTLSWNASTGVLSISDSNSIDLSSLEADLTGYATESYVDAAIANVDVSGVEGNYGDSNVRSLLNSFDGNIAPSANSIYSLGNETHRWKELFLSGNSIYINGSVLSDDHGTLKFNAESVATQAYVATAVENVTVDLTGYATESYVDSAVNAIIDGANINLDTLAEVSSALGNSNSAISTVAFTGSYTDLSDKPTLALSGTDLTLDGTTVDLSGLAGSDGVDGAQGAKGDTGATGIQGLPGINGNDGADGADGVGIVTAEVTNGDFIITYSNTSVQNLGDITGPQGVRGERGEQGIQGETGPAGATGAQGIQGETGAQGISGNDGADGANGVNGQDGVSISSATTASGNLIITLTDSTTIDAGEVNYSNVSSGSADTGNITFSGDTVSSTGNGIMLQADYVNLISQGGGPIALSHGGDSWLFNADGTLEVPGDIVDVNGNSVLGDPDQTLSLTGSTLTISGSNSSVDLSSLGGGATYTSGTGIVVDNAEDTIALANTAVSPGTYGSSTRSPVITVDQQGRITSIQNATISGGTSSGGGSVIERFRLNYTSSGALAGTSDLSGGIAGVTINSTTGGEVTIEFSGYNLPPGSIMFYGYDYTNNKYVIVPMETSMGFREIPAGGSSGAPTLFDGADTVEVKLRLREAETGASRGGFGTVTHAWIQFVMHN